MKNLIALFFIFTSSFGRCDDSLIKLKTYGQPIARALKSGDIIKVFDWNTHKYADAESLVVITEYAAFADFILLQETMMGSDYEPFFSGLPRFQWFNAESWQKSKTLSTGVSTGAAVRVINSFGIRSFAREPVLRTPKMIAVTEHPIDGRDDTLLVVDIHGINFVTTKEYKTQIAQLMAAVKTHQGPMLVAGDFNLWNKSRGRVLDAMAKTLGLTHIRLDNDHRRLALDQLFVRGMKVVKAEVVNQSGSDHLPIYAEFQL